MADNWEEIPEVLVLVDENGAMNQGIGNDEKTKESKFVDKREQNDEDTDITEDTVNKIYEDLDVYYYKPFTITKKSHEALIGLKQYDEDEAAPVDGHVLHIVRACTKNSSEQIRQQSHKFVDDLVTKEDRMLVFMIDGTKGLSDEFAGILKEALQKIISSRNSSYRGGFIFNGLQKSIPFNPPGSKISVCSSNDFKKIDGLQEFDKDYHASVNDATGISDNIERVLLLEKGKPFEVFRYRIAILNALFVKDDSHCPCIKLIAGGSEDLIVSIAAGEYFEQDVPTLIVNTGSKFIKALSAFVESLKTNSEETAKREKVLAKTAKDYSVTENAVKEMINEFKNNIWKIDVCADVTNTSLIESISSTISKGINPSISCIMDRTQEVGQNLTSSNCYQTNSKILHFQSLGVFPNDKSFFGEELQILFGNGNVKEFNAIKEQMLDNLDKVFLYNEDSPGNDIRNATAAKKLYNTVHARMDWQSLIPYDLAVDRRLLRKDFRDEFYKHCPVLGIKKALKENNFKLADYLLNNRPIDLYPYIYFNMFKHWYDSSQEVGHRISRHFKIVNIHERLSKGDQESMHWEFSAKTINKAISKLTNRMVTDVFTEDGRPNIKVFTPIQALMVNRLFNMQLEFVKILWRYDKRNAMTNGLMLWMLISGILKENIFKDEGLEEHADKLNKMKTYFEEAIRKLLDIAQNNKQIAPSDLSRNPVHCRFAAFKGKKVFEIAGEVRCDTVLIHPLGRRSLPEDWNRPSVESNYRIKRVFDSPRNKLYIHMFMYIVCYFLLAYYTLQTNTKGSVSIKWVTFVLIASLLADETHQAINNEESIAVCFKTWWSDNWNKLDFISMLLYYIAFILDVSGVSASRALFSIFCFVWCLKFYQFLRAFESLGTYIILIQKMLPHLGNFIVITMVAMIGYGVFMTSILFPNIKLNTWGPLLMILFRPYLLLFAETGINRYGLSSETTLFGTGDIGNASEMLILLGMCIFLMFGAVLLINLLIAIFSGIYEDVKEKSQLHWVVNGCQLLQEFRKKSFLPIPFSLPIDLFGILKLLIVRNGKESSLSIENWTRVEVEHEIVKDCMMKFVKKEADDVDSLQKLQDFVMEHVDERMERSVAEISNRIGASVADSNDRIGSSVAEINDRVETTFTTLSNQIDAMEKHNREVMTLLRELKSSHPVP